MAEAQTDSGGADFPTAERFTVTRATSEIEGYEDFSWDGIWASVGTITDDGYVVEVAVPFKSLHFPRTEEPRGQVVCPRSVGSCSTRSRSA